MTERAESASAQGESELELYAVRGPDERLRATWLLRGPDAWFIEERIDGARGTPRPLPRGALAAVFARYARPLDVAVPSDASDASVSDGAGTRLRAFSFMRWGDVHPQEYILLESPATEPVAAPAPLIAAALSALSSRGQDIPP
jgi:hypothetical protein